jgi:O-antigen/teichoic acid export membrane protein
MTCPTAGNAALRMSATTVVDVPDTGPQAWIHAFVVNVLFGLLNSFIRFGVGMLLLAYVVRRIGPQQWGLVVIATSAVAFMALVQLGASAGLGKQLNEHLSRGDFDRFTQVFTAGVVLCTLLSVLVIAGLGIAVKFFWRASLLSPEMSAEGRFVFLAVGMATACTSLTLPFTACLQALHRIDIDSKVQTLAILLRAVGVVVVFEGHSATASSYAVVMFAGALFALIGTGAWVVLKMPLARVRLRVLERHVIFDLITFNGLAIFNSVNYVAFMQAPALLLARSGDGGLVAVGLYGVALQLNNLTRGLLLPVFSALQPVAVSLQARRAPQLRRVFILSTKAFAAAGLAMWCGFVILGESFLRAWLGSSFPGLEGLQAALPWLVGASALGVAAMPAATYLVALGRLRLSAIAGLALTASMVVVLAVYLPSDSRAAIMDTGIALTVFFGGYQLLRIGVVARELHLRWDLTSRAVLQPTCTGIACMTAAWMLRDRSLAGSPAALVAAAIACGAVLSIVVVTMMVTPEERRLALRLMAGARTRMMMSGAGGES